MIVAHQGGWDELLLVGTPVVVFAFLLWLARARADAEPEDEEEGEAGDRDGDQAGPARRDAGS